MKVWKCHLMHGSILLLKVYDVRCIVDDNRYNIKDVTFDIYCQRY